MDRSKEGVELQEVVPESAPVHEGQSYEADITYPPDDIYVPDTVEPTEPEAPQEPVADETKGREPLV